MKVALLASMRVGVGFDKRPSINGINKKIVCSGMNVFKDNDEDSEDFISTFGTLEDAMLSLSMACFYHRLYSVVMLMLHQE